MKTTIKLALFILLFGCKLVYGQTYSEILGRPTNNSITLSVLFDQHVDIYVEYGTISGSYPNSTSVLTNVTNIPNQIELQGLSANTKYYYRTRYRQTGVGSYLTGTEHSFYTQRSVGSTFTFTVEADEHLNDKKGVTNLYSICLANQAKDKPDFMFDLGDNFGDDHKPFTITSAQLDSLHKVYIPFYGSICHSVPLLLCLGNHEGEKDYYLQQTPPNNMAVYGTLARKKYFPNPYPNSFYSGDTLHEGYGMGQPENYYAFTWGDALFVVMDVYRYDCDTSAKPQKWDWTLGFTEYSWLKNTLENSTAQYKFVFAHHVSGEGRGGIVQGKLFEWGGYEANGTTYGFTTMRPGWAKPIHQLFKDNGVNIFFQGHDHLFAREVMDNVVYQEVPMPSDSTYEIGMLANADAYTADTLDGSGHIRVTVSPSCVTVDYIRAYLPMDTVSGVHHNREVAFSYTIGTCLPEGIKTENKNTSVEVYPNPAANNLNIVFPEGIEDMDNIHINLINAMGQTVLQSTSLLLDISHVPNGLYFLNVASEQGVFNKKVIISR